MQYKVIKPFRGSPDGSRTLSFAEGEILSISTDFSEDLAKVAVEEKWVEPVKEKAPKKKAAAKK